MSKIVVLTAKNADTLADLINQFFVQIAGREARIINIVPDGNKLSAFINVESDGSEIGVTEK